jgi:ABC-type branched-subunit amino acid transport system ATPase component
MYFDNSTKLGAMGLKTGIGPFWWDTSTVFHILHSGTSHIKNGVITINGASITPLTSHQSLANYVTLNTNQTITG